jgi:hypothetical protein
MKFYKILFIILLFLVNVFAQTKYAVSYLELGTGARAVGMGGAYAALSNDATGFYWNPAGLALQPNIQAAAMHANLLNGLETQNFFGASVPIFGGATIGIGAITLTVDDIGLRIWDIDNAEDYYVRQQDPNRQLKETDGYFSDFEAAGFITFAKYLSWNLDMGWKYFNVPIDVGYGLNFKYITQQLNKNSGSGIGIDLGGIMRVGLHEIFQEIAFGDLIFGLNIQDITGTQITWDTDSKHKDKIGYNIKFGMAYVQPMPSIDSQITFAYDFDTKYDFATHLGVEYLYHSMFALRLGLNEGSFTTGAGIYFWKLKVDYAYQNHDLGNSHRISLLFGL